MKYRPEFPDRLGCVQDSRAFAQGFFRWYNQEHYHSGLALLTPAMVHRQQTGPILQQPNKRSTSPINFSGRALCVVLQNQLRFQRRSGSTNRST
jgi:hypothetical protein